MFWMRNIQKCLDQSPLDVVESIATIFSCLKDSTDISQVLHLMYYTAVPRAKEVW